MAEETVVMFNDMCEICGHYATAQCVECVVERRRQAMVLDHTHRGLRTLWQIPHQDIYSLIVKHTRNGIVVTDESSNILLINRAFTEVTGYTPSEVVGKPVRILQSGRHSREFYEQMWRGIREKGFWEGEIWNKRKNGEIYPEWLSVVSPKTEHGSQYFLGIFTDITSRKRYEELLVERAQKDPLTGLFNRHSFYDEAERYLKSGRAGAILFIDLDGFKNINDTLGHAAGDAVLQDVASCIRAVLGERGGLPARLGGDEFCMLLTDDYNSAEVAQTLLTRLSQLFAEGEITANASVGVSHFPHDASNFSSLLKLADAAMYRAKQLGGGTYCFHADTP